MLRKLIPLTIFRYRLCQPSFLVSSLDGILCLYRADKCMLLNSDNTDSSMWKSPLDNITYAIGGKWLCKCCFAGYSFQDLFKKALSILVWFLSSFFPRIQGVQSNNSTDMDTVWKNSRLILSDYYMAVNRSIAVHVLSMCMLTSLSVDEIFLPRYINRSTNFRGLPLKVEMIVHARSNL